MFVFADRLSRVQLEEAVEFIAHQCTFVNTVELVVQLGSGCPAAGLLDETWHEFPLNHMPHMPSEPSTAHHPLRVYWGTIGPLKTLIFAGRHHLYEGYGRLPCLLPIWTAAAVGARTFLFTNAAGAVHRDYAIGDLMCATDHLNQTGVSALAGHQHLFDDPFVDMSDVYSPALRTAFVAAAKAEDLTVHEGVYLANGGPQFETPAEVSLASRLGADAVGMSTVLEATLAHALGARVVAVSLITNPAAGLGGTPLRHRDHLAVSGDPGKKLVRAIRAWATHHGAGHF